MPQAIRFSLTATDVLTLLSSLCFFIGSVLFLPRFAQWAEQGVWLFMLGSLLMFVGCLVASFSRHHRQE